MLGEVIREIVFASSPVDMELALTDAIAYPIVVHVLCLGASLLDGVIGDALSSVIVGADGSWSFRDCTINNNIIALPKRRPAMPFSFIFLLVQVL